MTWISWKWPQERGEQVAAKFKELHPNVDVKYQWMVPTDYWPAVKLALASGDAPDLWFITPGALFNEDAPFAEDLAPLAAQAWGPDWQKLFVAGPLEKTKVGTTHPGLPVVILGAGTLNYNKGIFDKLGLTPPKTMDEWLTVAGKLKAAGIIPFVQGASEDWINFDHYLAIVNQIAPGKAYEADTCKASWTDPGLVESMTFWKSLFGNGIMQDGAVGIPQFPDADDLYVSQKAGMIMHGTWYGTRMTRTFIDGAKTKFGLTEDFEFVPMQYPDINGDGKLGPMTVGPDAIAMMSKDSKNKEATWAFLQFLLSPEIQKSQNADFYQMSPLVSVKLDPSLAQTDAQRAGLDLWAGLLQDTSYPWKLDRPETTNALGVALQKVASGQQTPADALAAVQKVADGVCP